MLEVMISFLKKYIVVMDFSVKHLMYQLVSPEEILHKLQISYVTEACVGKIQGAQNTG